MYTYTKRGGKQLSFVLIESTAGVADVYVPRSIFVGQVHVSFQEDWSVWH